MVQLIVVLVIALIAVGIVLAVGRDSNRDRYSGGRGMPRRPAYGDLPARAPTAIPGDWDDDYSDDDGDDYEAAEAARPARSRARVETSRAREGEVSGGGRLWLVLIWVALGVFAAVLLVAATRSGGGGGATDDGASGAAAAPSPASAATSPSAATNGGRAGSSTASATPTRTTTSTPAPANVATLLVQAREAANVRVTVDGRVDYEGALRAGESRSWAGVSRVGLWTDNGKNVAVTVNGFDLGALSTAVGHPEWNTVDWSWAAGARP